jgi:hypothetical protein
MRLFSSFRALKRARSLAVALMFVLLGSIGVAVASPAQAEVTGAYYQDAFYFGCLHGSADSDGPNAKLNSGECYGAHTGYDDWRSIAKGTSPSDHKLIQLKSLWNDKCIDSNAADTGGAAWVKTCSSTSKYQMWEVFKTSGDLFVFKSWGAWKNQDRHRCLQASGNPGVVKMAVCDVKNDAQRWG